MTKRVFLLFCLLAPAVYAQVGGRVTVGTFATRPSACSAGDLYVTSDTNLIYQCGPANTWVVTPSSNSSNSFTGNNTHSGTETFTGPFLAQAPGTFTGMAQNVNMFETVNGSAAWQPQGPGSQEGIVGSMTVPSTATITQANAIAGYVTNSSTGMGGGGAVAGYFKGVALANNANVWGLNPLVQVNSGLNPNLAHATSIEVDVNNITGTDWNSSTGTGVFDGIDVISGGTNKPRMGISVQSPNNPTNTWAYGLGILNYAVQGLQVGGPTGSVVPGAIGVKIFASDGLVTSRAVTVVNTAGSSEVAAITDNGEFVSPVGAAVGTLFSESADIASSGFARLANTDKIAWRNAANNADDIIGEIQTQSTSGCPTSGGASAFTGPCTVTVSWPSPFADTSYRATCTGNGISAGVPILQGIITQSSTSVIVQTQQATGVNASFTSIECIAVHE